MTGQTGYSRNRSRNRAAYRREAPKGDAITTALTAQVIAIICILLALYLLSKANEDSYQDIKQEYNVMVTDINQNNQFFTAAEKVEGVFSGFMAWLEQLMNYWFGTGTTQPAQEEDSQPEALPEPEDTPTTRDFGYQYLNDDSVLFTSASGGQGGMHPVETQKATAPPSDATYAQVAIPGKMKPPVTGIVTSPFSYREHPITGAEDFHTGIDISAEEGRPVLAALPGEIVEIGESSIYGNYVIMKHSTNLCTFYAHCSEILADEGAAIRQGERIAKVGQTGMATGPHLHFSVIVEGMFTDPCWLLQDNIRLVEG